MTETLSAGPFDPGADFFRWRAAFGWYRRRMQDRLKGVSIRPVILPALGMRRSQAEGIGTLPGRSLVCHWYPRRAVKRILRLHVVWSIERRILAPCLANSARIQLRPVQGASTGVQLPLVFAKDRV